MGENFQLLVNNRCERRFQNSSKLTFFLFYLLIIVISFVIIFTFLILILQKFPMINRNSVIGHFFYLFIYFHFLRWGEIFFERVNIHQHYMPATICVCIYLGHPPRTNSTRAGTHIYIYMISFTERSIDIYSL